MTILPEKNSARLRRIRAEQFCLLAQREASSVYRPHSEVLRMLAAGEAWAVCENRSEPVEALLTLPLNADTACAAALREYLCWDGTHQGCILTPPIGSAPQQAPALAAAAVRRAAKLCGGGPVWAVLECTAGSEPLATAYLKQGFALRAIRPLDSLSPCYLFGFEGADAPAVEPIWVPLGEMGRVAALLARGWAAVDSRPSPQGTALALCPV